MHSACSPDIGVPSKVETIPARGLHTPPRSHGMTTVLCGEHPRSSRCTSKVTLLWVEGSQPGRAQTTAGFAEPCLVPHYCHEDLDPVRVSLCADRSHEKRAAWLSSAGSTQCLLQGQSPCPAPARGSATLIPAWHSHLGTEQSNPCPKPSQLGKVFPEQHCHENALCSWQQ